MAWNADAGVALQSFLSDGWTTPRLIRDSSLPGFEVDGQDGIHLRIRSVAAGDRF